MATTRDRRSEQVSLLAAASTAGALPLFLGAALSDAAHASSHEIQWSNFAAWLLLGALVFSGVALAFAARNALPRARRTRPAVAQAVVLALAWVAGLLDTLVHMRDAWAVMPAALVYSWIAFALILVATWMAFRRPPGATP